MPWYKGKHYAYTAEGRAQHKRDMQKDKNNPHPRPRDLKDATGLRDTRTPEPKMVAAGLRKPTAASRAATQEQREKAKALVAMGVSRLGHIVTKTLPRAIADRLEENRLRQHSDGLRWVRKKRPMSKWEKEMDKKMKEWLPIPESILEILRAEDSRRAKFRESMSRRRTEIEGEN